MTPRPSKRLTLVVAFTAVYLIWGSTYLGIRIAIETIPPFLMTATRFLLAGGLLYAWERMRGVPRPALRYWRSAVTLGAFLFLGGNAMVVLAETVVPSGLAALLVASEPMWIVVLLWATQGERPGRGVVTGLVLGLVGLFLLVGPTSIGGAPVAPLGAVALVLAALSWATGSLLSRNAPQPTSHAMGVATTMLAGGVLVLMVSLILGEPARFEPAAVSFRSVAALLYLSVFGSIVTFSAYLWLMRNTTAQRASTYAYVNPVVAVLLGWAVAGEPLNTRILIAGLSIVAAVWLIISQPVGGATGEHPLPRPRTGSPDVGAKRAA